MFSIRNRFIFLIGGLSVIFVILSYSNNVHSWPTSLLFLTYLLDLIQLPAIVVGALISGNVHQPNAIASYIALFITYVVIFSAVIAFFRFFYKQKKQ
jgi:hypothetical protein